MGRKEVKMRPCKVHVYFYNKIYAKSQEHHGCALEINSLREAMCNSIPKNIFNDILKNLSQFGMIEFKKNYKGFGTLYIEAKKTKWIEEGE